MLGRAVAGQPLLPARLGERDKAAAAWASAVLPFRASCCLLDGNDRTQIGHFIWKVNVG